MYDKTLFLTDTKNKFKKRISFKKNISIYVCGITPYDEAHIGHGRCYIVYDILYRWLNYYNWKPFYVRNITDIDDKLINKAIQSKNDPHYFMHIATHFYNLFITYLDKLNCKRPNLEPRVTSSIENIIDFISILLEKKYAYIIENDGVYFSIDKDKNYGRLSKRNILSQVSGERITINEKKKNPLDFVLWKVSENEPHWKSPFGNGRPGWHIECSAMSHNAIGKNIDIHGGGMDLIFPHHENEEAQSHAYDNESNVNCWMHCAFISINNEKMSKSVGNTILIKDILTKYEPMIFRYFIITHHYTIPINFSYDLLEHAEKEYKNILTILNFSEEDKNDFEKKEFSNKYILDEIEISLANDLNIQKVIGLIFSYSEKIKKDIILKLKIREIFIEILGIDLKKIESNICLKTEIEIEKLLYERENARKNRNFTLADKIREKLILLGHSPQDKKSNKI